MKDVTEYLEQRQQEADDEQNYRRILRELQAMLEKNTPYAELELKYGELKRTEHELPEGLRGQMESLEEEHELLEQRRHVRRSIYGVSLALLTLVLIWGAVLLIQYRNQVKTTCGEMNRLKSEGKFEEGLELFEKLKTAHPRVSRAPSVVSLESELKLAIEERDARIQSAQQEFEQLQRELMLLLKKKLLESTELDALLKRGAELTDDLTAKQKAEFIRMQSEVSQTRETIRKNREEAFASGSQALLDELEAVRQKAVDESHQCNLDMLATRGADLKKQMERLISESKVEAKITNQQKELFDRQSENVDMAIEQERQYRRLAAQLARPASEEEYLKLLDGYPTLPAGLQAQYAQAYARRSQDRKSVV